MIKINLLEIPKEKETKAIAVSAAPPVSSILIFGIIIVVIGIVIAGVWWYQVKKDFESAKFQLETARKELRELQPYIKEVVIYEKKKNLLAAKKDAIDLLRRSRSMPVHIMDEIASNLPQFLWLDSVTIRGNSTIDIKGSCTNKLDPSTFVDKLEQSKFFEDVKLLQVNLNQAQSAGGESYSFIISAKIVNPFQQQSKGSS